MPKKGKKGKKAAAAAAAVEPEPEPEASVWTCPECEQENEAEDLLCIACEEPKPAFVDPRYAGYKVGLVVSVELVDGKNLAKLEVDVGGDEPLAIVTNDLKLREGARCVVATIGAAVGEIEVKKASVGGHKSEGMLCDCPMLGWQGGAAGVAAKVPDSFAIGGPPPSTRPRMDQ